MTDISQETINRLVEVGTKLIASAVHNTRMVGTKVVWDRTYIVSSYPVDELVDALEALKKEARR